MADVKHPCQGCEGGEGGAGAVAAHQYLLDETALAPGHTRTVKALKIAAVAQREAREARSSSA